MLKTKTIENVISKFNQEEGVSIELTYRKFRYWDGVEHVTLNGVSLPLARVAYVQGGAVLDADFTKAEVVSVMNSLTAIAKGQLTIEDYEYEQYRKEKGIWS